MVRNEDEKELARKFNQEQVDTKSASAMFELLRRRLGYSPSYPHLLSLLQHMLLLPFTGSNTQHWLLFDRVVQQIILQSDQRPTSDVDPDTQSIDSKPHDPDMSPITIDVQKIVKLLVKEEELVAARSRAEELEKENLEVQAKLAKKEQDLDLRTQEKEDLETSLARMRERLEKESANHSQAMQRALNAEMKVEDLQHRYMQEQQERVRLERLVSEGSIPDDQKMAGLNGCNGQMSPPTAPQKTMPPPPPPSLAPPPPPPCPGGGPPPPSMPLTPSIYLLKSFAQNCFLAH